MSSHYLVIFFSLSLLNQCFTGISSFILVVISEIFQHKAIPAEPISASKYDFCRTTAAFSGSKKPHRDSRENICYKTMLRIATTPKARMMMPEILFTRASLPSLILSRKIPDALLKSSHQAPEPINTPMTIRPADA